jgi:hypothetical protein
VAEPGDSPGATEAVVPPPVQPTRVAATKATNVSVWFILVRVAHVRGTSVSAA